jgi:hypothetical protein
VSLDLGLSEVGVEHVEGGILLPDGSVVGMGDLEKVAGKEGAVFFPRDGILLQVALAGSTWRSGGTSFSPVMSSLRVGGSMSRSSRGG